MTKSKSQPRVVISKNGPYLVSGGVPLAKQTIVNLVSAELGVAIAFIKDPWGTNIEMTEGLADLK